MVYSEEELAEAAHAAREGAEYFRGLDWENTLNKWGRVATPWHDQYPSCWDDLAKVTCSVGHKQTWANEVGSEGFAACFTGCYLLLKSTAHLSFVTKAGKKAKQCLHLTALALEINAGAEQQTSEKRPR